MKAVWPDDQGEYWGYLSDDWFRFLNDNTHAGVLMYDVIDKGGERTFDLSDAKDLKDLFYLFLYVVSDKQELEGSVKVCTTGRLFSTECKQCAEEFLPKRSIDLYCSTKCKDTYLRLHDVEKT